MNSTKGWLYVSSQSATFVSDDSHVGFEKYSWSILADKLLLQSFLTFFRPEKQRRESSYDSYYLEIDEVVLEAWFECLVPASESSVFG